MNELTSRYAMSLFSLKKESSSLEDAQKVVKELIKIIKDNPEYPFLLDSSYLSKEKRIAMVDEAFSSLDEEIKNFIKIIVNNGRGKYLLEIFENFNSLVNEYKGVKEGLLYSSQSLTETQIEQITSSISSVERCQIELKNIIDPSLIGGVKVVINDHIYDGSLKHHLEEMRKTLLK